MEIRKLGNIDSTQVINLILPIQQNEFGVNVTLEDQPDLENIDQYYTAKGGIFLGAFIDNVLVGTVAFLNIGHHSAALRKMFVNKSFRGKEFGIAKQLLDSLEIECKKINIENIYLGTVDILKASHRFYEKNGFTLLNRSELPSYFPLMQV
ncbi:MAG: GNAT family N-acetyltransferase, partial [Pseudopedobacter saltans]